MLTTMSPMRLFSIDEVFNAMSPAMPFEVPVAVEVLAPPRRSSTE